MEANFKLLEIDIYDIWQYEVYQYLSGERAKDLMKRTYDFVCELIVKNGMPSFSLNNQIDYEENYLNNQIINWNKAQANFDEQICLGYFISNGKVYEFTNEIILDNLSDYYYHFFLLKISQYRNNLVSLKLFLDFQFDKTKFLTKEDFYNEFYPCTLQEPELLSDGLKETIKLWVDFKKNTLDVKLKKEPKNIDFKGELKTFYLKKKRQDPDIFSEGSYLIMFSELFTGLKGTFIDDKTSREAFFKIFSNNSIMKNEKIIWIATIPELKEFINLIFKANICCQIPDGDQWKIGSNCFSYRKRKSLKNVVDLESNQISNPGQAKNLENIRSIINKFLKDYSLGSKK